MTGSSSLPNSAYRISTSGEITVDASALDHTYLGTYLVTVTVAFEAYGAIRPTTLTFTLTIDPCVVTGLTLYSPPWPDLIYTIGDAAKVWVHD